MGFDKTLWILTKQYAIIGWLCAQAVVGSAFMMCTIVYFSWNTFCTDAAIDCVTYIKFDKNHDIVEFTLEIIIEHVINNIRLVALHYSKPYAFEHGQMHNQKVFNFEMKWTLRWMTAQYR